MSSSKVQIANSALLKIGASRINSFDDNKTEAIVISEFYERSYAWLFAQYYWGFANKTVQLAKLPTPPLQEYAHAFQLPNDMVRVQRTFPNSNYKILGNELHTNEESIAIKYTFKADEADIPVYFEQTMMYYLASQICISITENVTKDKLLYEQYLDHIKRAKSLDAQQYPQDGFQDFPLHDSRFGGM